jgi:hypothetical protein
MTALADTWEIHRQQCIMHRRALRDLRLPYDPTNTLLKTVVRNTRGPSPGRERSERRRLEDGVVAMEVDLTDTEVTALEQTDTAQDNYWWRQASD